MKNSEKASQAWIWFVSIYLLLIFTSRWCYGLHFSNELFTQNIRGAISLGVVVICFLQILRQAERSLLTAAAEMCIGLQLALICYEQQLLCFGLGAGLCVLGFTWDAMSHRIGKCSVMLLSFFCTLEGISLLMMSSHTKLSGLLNQEDGSMTFLAFMGEPWMELILLTAIIILLVMRGKKAFAGGKEVRVSADVKQLFVQILGQNATCKLCIFGLFLLQARQLSFVHGYLPWENGLEKLPLVWGEQARLYQLWVFINICAGCFQIPLGRKLLQELRIELEDKEACCLALLAASLPWNLFLDSFALFGGILQVLAMAIVYLVVAGIRRRKPGFAALAALLIALLLGYLWFCGYLYVWAAPFVASYVLYLFGKLFLFLHRFDWMETYKVKYVVIGMVLIMFAMQSETLLENYVQPYTGRVALASTLEEMDAQSISNLTYQNAIRYALENWQNQVEITESEQEAPDLYLVSTGRRAEAFLQKKAAAGEDLYLVKNFGDCLLLAAGEDVALRNDCDDRLLRLMDFDYLQLDVAENVTFAQTGVIGKEQSPIVIRENKATIYLQAVDQQEGALLNAKEYGIGYHTYASDGTLICYDYDRTGIDYTLTADNQIAFSIDLRLFEGESGYFLIDVVWENHAWMSWDYPTHCIAFWYEDGELTQVEDISSLPHFG